MDDVSLHSFDGDDDSISDLSYFSDNDDNSVRNIDEVVAVVNEKVAPGLAVLSLDEVSYDRDINNINLPSRGAKILFDGRVYSKNKETTGKLVEFPEDAGIRQRRGEGREGSEGKKHRRSRRRGDKERTNEGNEKGKDRFVENRTRGIRDSAENSSFGRGNQEKRPSRRERRSRRANDQDCDKDHGASTSATPETYHSQKIAFGDVKLMDRTVAKEKAVNGLRVDAAPFVSPSLLAMRYQLDAHNYENREVVLHSPKVVFNIANKHSFAPLNKEMGLVPHMDSFRKIAMPSRPDGKPNERSYGQSSRHSEELFGQVYKTMGEFSDHHSNGAATAYITSMSASGLRASAPGTKFGLRLGSDSGLGLRTPYESIITNMLIRLATVTKAVIVNLIHFSKQ